MYIIYKITNKVNNKVYIGLTRRTFKKRWYMHVWEANNRNTRSNFHNAIKKYDKDIWISEIVCCCINKQHAEEMECHFIKENDSYKNGYNMTEGGNAFGGLVGKFNGMYGRTHTQKVKNKLARAAKKRFKGKSYNELYGTERADELKQKRGVQSIKRKQNRPFGGAKNPNFDTKIYTFEHINGNRFTGTQSVFRELYSLNKSEISQLIHQKRKTAKGWRLTSSQPF